LFRRAARRGIGVALVYHRVAPEVSEPYQIVPTLQLAHFRRQMELLREVGDVLPLDELLANDRAERPRFAVTFDDDLATHAKFALPALRELGIRATFFLSGRCLHRLPPYWWELLEADIAVDGLPAVCARLGARASTPADLAAQCEGTPLVERIHQDFARRSDSKRCRARLLEGAQLGPDEIRALASAGMDLGFHTLAHELLPSLPDPRVEEALREGREELQDASGQRLELLAYPHGKTDSRVSRLARGAGYRAAFTGTGRAIGARSGRFALSRWEPPQDGVEGFVEGLARCVSRAPVELSA